MNCFYPHTEYVKKNIVMCLFDLENFLEKAQMSPSWDCFDEEEWRSACDYCGLDYDSYEDPDRLFDDLVAKCEEFAR